MDDAVTQCRHLLTLAGPVLDRVTDERRALWLIGHLAVTGDFARRMCGRQPLCPVPWRSLFNPGSTPDAGTFPPAAELADHFRRVYLDLCDAVAGVTPDVLAAVNPYKPARDRFPTSGAFLAWMLAGHLGYHLGQLSSLPRR